MKDFFEDLYDEDKNEEPTFSLYEFKQWLSKQKDTSGEVTERRKKSEKDDLEKKFKERVHKKIRKKKED